MSAVYHCSFGLICEMIGVLDIAVEGVIFFESEELQQDGMYV